MDSQDRLIFAVLLSLVLFALIAVAASADIRASDNEVKKAAIEAGCEVLP